MIIILCKISQYNNIKQSREFNRMSTWSDMQKLLRRMHRKTLKKIQRFSQFDSFYMFPFVISRPSTYTMHSEMFFILPPSLHLNGRLTVSDGKWTFCHNILFSPDNSINVNFPTKIPITYPCYLMVVYQ